MNGISLIAILCTGLITLAKAFPPIRSQSLKERIQNFVDNDFIIETPRILQNPGPFQVPIQPGNIGIVDDMNFATPTTADNDQESLRFRWPGGIVPIEISDQFTADEISLIRRAVAEFETWTCIRFIWRLPQIHISYVRFEATDENTCVTQFGHTTGPQTITLNKRTCFSFGIILHEMMHALGFLHEQSRPDRDIHVSILWQNIIPGKESQFQIYDRFKAIGPYDIDSVMHYDSNAFSKNGYSTILSHDWRLQNRMGQKNGFSTGDLGKINMLYKCYLSKNEREMLYAREMQAVNEYYCYIRSYLCMSIQPYPMQKNTINEWIKSTPTI